MVCLGAEGATRHNPDRRSRACSVRVCRARPEGQASAVRGQVSGPGASGKAPAPILSPVTLPSGLGRLRGGRAWLQRTGARAWWPLRRERHVCLGGLHL